MFGLDYLCLILADFDETDHEGTTAKMNNQVVRKIGGFFQPKSAQSRYWALNDLYVAESSEPASLYCRFLLFTVDQVESRYCDAYILNVIFI